MIDRLNTEFPIKRIIKEKVSSGKHFHNVLCLSETRGMDINMNQVKCRLTKNQLLSKGFRFSRVFSNDENEVYTYRFPVYKYEKMIVLECELRVVLGEDKIDINVYDYNTNDKYAPFYYCEYGDYNQMLKIINEKIEHTMKKLNIERDYNTNGATN